MPHLKELHTRYKDQGLVLIGIHTTDGSEKMAGFVKEHSIPYPVAADVDKKTVTAYAVDSFPDYYLIDRKGNLRVADLANADLDRAVKVLLAEGQAAPKKAEEPAAAKAVPIDEQDAAAILTLARERARAEDKRVFIHVGGPG